jgi:hypothetical protein
VCAVAPTGACANGDACVEAGDTLQLCVLLPGDVDCPAGRPVRTSLVSDSTCECSCGTEQTCDAGGAVDLYQQPACNSIATAIPADGLCHDSKLPGIKAVAVSEAIPAAGVSCIQEAAESESPSTLCCPW